MPAFYHMTPFRIKPSPVATPISEHVSLPNEEHLLETLEFFDIIHGSYQPLNFLPYLPLSTQYSILISLVTLFPQRLEQIR